MNNKKTMKVIIIVTMLIFSSILILALSNRYQYINGKVFDKLTGNVKDIVIINPSENDKTIPLEYIQRAEQYQKDVNAGIVDNASKYDIERIKNGLKPIGKYKNKTDEPAWISGDY